MVIVIGLALDPFTKIMDTTNTITWNITFKLTSSTEQLSPKPSHIHVARNRFTDAILYLICNSIHN